MTREQLINEIQDKVASPPDPREIHQRQVWYDKEMKEAIVLAYNKGIEDARCVAECGYLKEIESLKIKKVNYD